MPSVAARQTAARVAMTRRFGPAMPQRPGPPPRPPTLIESDYAHRLVRIVDQLRQVVQHELSAGPGVRLDDDSHQGAEARRRIKRARVAVDNEVAEQRLEHVARDYATRIAVHQRQVLKEQAEAALGTDVITLDAEVPSLIAGFVHENVALIRKLQGDTLGHLETLMTRAAATSMSSADLQEAIADRFAKAERHARLIAMDQSQKLNSRITRARHQEIGVDAYWWKHMPRIKPRPHHVARDGLRFQYDKPPYDGHPGTQIACGCLQLPDWSSVHQAADDVLPQVAPEDFAEPKPTLLGRAKKWVKNKLRIDEHGNVIEE